jgi:hypothetical protein
MRVRLQSNRLNDNPLHREVVTVSRAGAESIEHIEPLLDLTKDGILPIELRERL